MSGYRQDLNHKQQWREVTAITAVFLFLAVLICASPCRAELLPPADLSKAEIVSLGERMYREGILPSGKVMEAYIRDDVAVDSSAFSCSSCHLRAGLGSFEGGVVTPPTTGNKLYKPYRRPPSLGDTLDRAGRHIYAKTIVERPAYTRESLATGLRFGIDPAGQNFNDVMPRYPLTDRDLSILISYLELLSSEPSSGASSSEFKFATIITDDVNQEDRQALLRQLNKFIAEKNQQMEMFDDFTKFGYSPTIDMQFAFKKASLAVWELKGAAETWPGQLAAYYAENQVFAVLGGISNSDWRPIHDFCEAQHLPCLFPITEFPVISETGWYTYYFNKGYVQEGDAVARYLNRMETFPADVSILQIVQDSPTGKSLAAGFQKSWNELERPAVKTLTLTASQLLDQEAMAKLLIKHKPEVLLLWTDAGILQHLPKLLPRLSGTGMVFMSSSYLGNKTASTPEAVRNKIYFTFPYRLTPFVGEKTGGYDAKVAILTSAKDFGDRRVASRVTAMLQQATLQGLYLLYDNLYRDHLLDVMSMQMDLTVRDYERFSFGPGQRYVSKGCYIIQLGSGDDPALLKRSDWVMH